MTAHHVRCWDPPLAHAGGRSGARARPDVERQMEEMAHIAQVAILMVPVAHDLISAGRICRWLRATTPAGIRTALRRFDLATLEHFIFFGAPRCLAGKRGADSPSDRLLPPRRAGVSMPIAPDYATCAHGSRLCRASQHGGAAGVDVDRVLVERAREAQLPNLELPPDVDRRVAERLAALATSLSQSSAIPHAVR
jgi:hypothetical protein